MSDPSESQRFLQVAESLDRDRPATGDVALDEEAARLKRLAEALPAAAPRRQLVHRSVLAIALAVLPLILWGIGFAAFPLLLLYWLEGWCVAATNLYRILFAAGPAEGPRAPVACRYALFFAVPWAAIGAAFWFLYAPDETTRGLLTGWHWRELVGYVHAQRLGWPLAFAAATLVVQAAQASANIDAYLVFGARTVARYGYGRIFAAISLLALTPAFAEATSYLPNALSTGNEAQRTGLVLVLFLAAVRLLAQLADLWLPVWGRGLFRFGAAVSTGMAALAPPTTPAGSSTERDRKA